MQVFIARQPIFDTGERVVGYELLHRSGAANRFSGIDGTVATGQLLSDSVLTGSWRHLTGGSPAWVNFPASLLLDGSATLVAPEHLVIELLETIRGGDEVVEACRDLKSRGYRLAADDVIDPDDDSPLLSFADIVKVDFRDTTVAQRMALSRRFRGRAQLLAEKVETRAEQQLALSLGFELLQGYFLHEPTLVRHHSVDHTRRGVLAVLETVMTDPLDFGAVERALKREVSLTDKLLRYLNSARFAWRRRTTSLVAALIALGEVNVRRWVAVAALSTIAADSPDELLVSTLVRARMCESLCPFLPGDVEALDLFLAGLYSQMHLLLGMEYYQALEEAPIPDRVRSALENDSGVLALALELVRRWESADWAGVDALTARLGMAVTDLPACYDAALAFVDELDAMAAMATTA
jgi:EAL and modified HD-GYP domain-containing signal transduction protein